MAGLDEVDLQKKTEFTSHKKPVPTHSSSIRKWFLFSLIALAAGGGYLAWRRLKTTAPAPPPVSKKERGGGAVPVVAERARRGSIDVLVNGLGVVTPIYTVTVKS